MSILQIVDLKKDYGEEPNITHALKGIQFEVDKGEFVGIMGASGSGKTTLLNCISTIDTATDGHIYLDGKDILEIREKDIARFRRESLGFIFQDFNLLDTLTIEENIALALTINKVSANKIDSQIQQIAAKLNITDILNKYPYQVSGGQKQRCACARAIINHPKLILADEPTGALDSHSSQMLLSTIQEMNEQMDATILMVFSNMSWILTTTIKKPSDFYYQNLFVLGQIKSKMASSAKTMGVISCILILSIVLMAWLPVNAIRASEYQKITSPFDVQVLTTYSASSLEELPKTTLDYDYITKYLNENGYPLSKAATGQLYLLQADDIDKTVKNAPLLAISVDSYNQMRALSDLPEITLDSDEYGIAWSFDTLPETITQFNQEVSSIHAGNSTLHKKSGADYQDPTGMVLFTSRMQAVYIIPDEICNNLLMATSFYAGNTEKPLAYDFAERFDQEMWKYQFNLGVFSENQLYVRLGTLQDNEGISNALLLRLVGAYAALVLIIICFTILSVQQLTDTIEQKKRFQIISKLGVNKSDCGRYIRQQMIFKFGLPVMVSLIFSIGTLAFLTLTGYEEYIVYISLNEMLAIFAVVYAAFIGILISYFVSTYYLFKKHMALS